MLEIKTLMSSVESKLLALSYTRDTVRHYKRCWDKLVNYMNDNAEVSLTKQVAEDFYLLSCGTTMDAPAKERDRNARMYSRSLAILLDFQETGTIYRRQRSKTHFIAECYEPIITNYFNELRQNVSRTSFRQHSGKIEAFLDFLQENRCNDFNHLTKTLILNFWETRTVVSINTRAYDAYALRKFFDYLYDKGHTDIDYSVFVPYIKGNKSGRIPSFYTPKEIETLLGVVDRANPIGKRDYTILLFAIRYGMRVGDIRNLKLSDLDWNNSSFTFIQQKETRPKTFPILDDVATALIDYFQNGRPVTECKNIFVRHNAPFEAFSQDNNLHNIASKYMKLAGLTELHHRKHGLHSFRHSVAGNMLDDGIPIPVISEILDHTSSDTTMIYTKIGTKQLKSCALEVD